MNGEEKVAIGILLGYLVVLLVGVVFWGTGIYLAFGAAIWLGVVMIFIPPAALIVGVAYLLGSIDLCKMLIQWLSGG